GDLTGGACQGAVEEVEEDRKDQEKPGAACSPGDERRGREQAHAEAGQREVIGAEMKAKERIADWRRPAAERLPVAAQHDRRVLEVTAVAPAPAPGLAAGARGRPDPPR